MATPLATDLDIIIVTSATGIAPTDLAEAIAIIQVLAAAAATSREHATTTATSP
jgi:hypothetical protein